MTRSETAVEEAVSAEGVDEKTQNGDAGETNGDDTAKEGTNGEAEPMVKNKKRGRKSKGSKKPKKSEDEEDKPLVKPSPKKKKPIPYWASLSDAQMAKMKANPKSLGGPAGNNAVQVIVDAIGECADAKGFASYILIKKNVMKKNPSWPKMVFKRSLRRSVEKKYVKQIRNSYKVISDPRSDKAPAKKVNEKLSSSRSKTKVVSEPTAGPLEELFPHIFTWVCEPKEASFALIRKYIEKHFPKLPADNAFKKAMESLVGRGQLDQITGKGASGTFQLVDGAKKGGSRYEDAVEDAIIASNEPKDASVPALRHYLSEFHTEYDVKNKPKVLKRALERAEAAGWIVRVTGKGFSGTFRLAYPYYPSPKDLWRESYDEANYEPRKRKTYDSSSEEEEDDDDEEEEEEDDSDDSDGDSDEDYGGSDREVIPKKKSRGPPKQRGDPAASRKKKAAKKSPTKTPAKAAGRTPKKSDAKTPAKASGKTPKKSPSSGKKKRR